MTTEKRDDRQPDAAAMSAAARWFVLLQDAEAASPQRAAFQAWLDRDADHLRAYERVETLWSAAETLPSLRRARPDRRKVLGSAAMGLAVLAAGGYFAVLREDADFRTGVGERRSVRLSDGTRVELSTDTSVAVSFGKDSRTVRLLKGEAFFRVAADPHRPFSVEADGGRTIALGTAFSVARQGGTVRVTVTEHAVMVQARGQARRLANGETVVYGGNGMSPAGPLDPAALAWRRGKLVFVSRPLSEVVGALDGWRVGRTVVLDDELAARPVTLMVDVDRAEEALQRLAETLPARISHLTPLLTLLRPI
jgi:transmembrane sensor